MPHKDPEARRAYQQAYRQRPERQAFEHTQARKAAKNLASTRFKKRHPEVRRAASKKLYARKSAEINAYQRTWREANPGKQNAYEKTARLRRNAERRLLARLYQTQWRRLHPEYARRHRDMRRARKLGAARNDFTRSQEALVLASKRGVCDYCHAYNPGCITCKRGNHALTIDHITALARQGDNTLWNITACCLSCNSKKGTRPPPVPVQPLLL